MRGMENFERLRVAILDLITLRRERLEALLQPDPDFEAALEDLETMYVELVDKTSQAEQDAIGEFYREALEVFGSNEEMFQAYPDAAGLLIALQVEGAREVMLGELRAIKGRDNPR